MPSKTKETTYGVILSMIVSKSGNGNGDACHHRQASLDAYIAAGSYTFSVHQYLPMYICENVTVERMWRWP